MSTRHFMTLLNHIKPELLILSKSNVRPCATTTVKSTSRTYHVHQATNRNGPLKQLGIFTGSYATRKLTLAKKNPSPMIRQFQYRAVSIKSSPPGQPRKKPDTRHQQETGQPDKRLLEPAAHKVEWASRDMFIRNLARQIEIREVATGFKSRIFRFVFWLALKVTGKDAFTMKPFIQSPRNQKLNNRALFQRRQEVQTNWAKHMRHVEKVEREIGREARILRRYLDKTSRINRDMSSKLRPFVRPYQRGGRELIAQMILKGPEEVFEKIVDVETRTRMESQASRTWLGLRLKSYEQDESFPSRSFEPQ